MNDDLKQKRLETEALLIGYAMSRLDLSYLSARQTGTWNDAFIEASKVLNVPPASFKNLRDEFDPVHPNSRQGWHRRPLRPNRLRIIDEMSQASDEAVAELVARILARDEEATIEAIDALAVATRVPANVAERLLTGRRAEDYFLSHSLNIIQIEPDKIIDLRQSALGFDFGINDRPELAIEVKGLKPISGGILFTDREWSEAKYRRDNYWLVVIGNLNADPKPRVFRDPRSLLKTQCIYQTSVTATWRSNVSVNF
jgi:hypothetical protein